MARARQKTSRLRARPRQRPKTPAQRPKIRILPAEAKDAARLAPLFAAYLRFYRLSVPSAEARRFLRDRLKKKQSAVFLALLETGKSTQAAGFVQLYPCFSSLSLMPHWILNDLYVRPEARRHGVARALMERARRLAVRTGADGLSLETAKTNRPAQRLYEQLGYRRDTVFYRYFLKV